MLSYDEIINKIDQLEEANLLITAIELRIFSILNDSLLSVKQVSKIAKTQFECTEVLLNALTSMGALNKKNKKFENTKITYKYFCETSEYYKKGTIMLKQDNRGEYEKLVKAMRKGRDLKSYTEDNSKFRHLFTYAMHERSPIYADKVSKIITKKKVGNLLDLGCGAGSYSSAILNIDKNSTAILFDRPTAIKVARAIHKKQNNFQRLKFISGDLFVDGFGDNYDTVLMSNILHIYSPRENKILLKKIYKIINKGGRIVLYDFFLKDNQTEPYNAALFAVTMILYTKTGKSYTYGEAESLLRLSGFTRFKRTLVGHGSSIIEAVKV